MYFLHGSKYREETEQRERRCGRVRCFLKGSCRPTLVQYVGHKCGPNSPALRLTVPQSAGFRPDATQDQASGGVCVSVGTDVGS